MSDVVASNLNVGAAAMAAEYAKISLHSASPGGSGANEISGGSPAYARKDTSVQSPSGGVVALLAAPVVFDVPAGATVAYAGLWTSGGTFKGSKALPSSETYTGQGTYTLTAASLTLA